MRPRRAFCVLFIVGFAWSCNVYRYHGAAGTPAPTERPSPLSYEKVSWHPRIERVGKCRHYRLFRIEAPSPASAKETAETVVMYYYRPRREGPAPALVLLPIYDGVYLLERFLAGYFARNGFAVLRFERTRELLRADQSIDQVREGMRRTLIDIRRGIDWLTGLPRIDPQRLGIMGTSFGAVLASVVMETDDRIRAGVFFLGGGDVGLLFARSGEEMMIRFREQVMRRNGYDLAAFQRRFSQAMREVDPLTYAPWLEPRRVLMINARWDRVVVAESTETLWKASGRPTLIRLWAGHYTAPLLHIFYVRRQARAHFRRWLEENGG